MIVIKYYKSIRCIEKIVILKGDCMGGGIITAKKGVGDVYFVDRLGKEVLDSSKGVEVDIKEEFSGFSVKDAIEEAKRYAMGAIQKKVAQKMRGFDCYAVVKDIKIKYNIKYGFVNANENSGGTKPASEPRVANKFSSYKKAR
jgi:hypothetical protein